jgi:hypothetical protein
MPHQCTNCGRTFPDGSKEMLSGCPDCGGNKFQFHPGSVADDAAGTSASSGASEANPPSSPPSSTTSNSTSDPDDGGLASKANASVRDWVRGRTGDTSENARSDAPSDTPSDTPTDEPPGPPSTSPDRPSADADEADGIDAEDRAQADARSGVVTPDELAEAADVVPPADSAADDPDDTPDLSDLRAELNEQFESIRIVDRGQYELNLMELYDREEYIISLQEDGRYVIEVSEPWRED